MVEVFIPVGVALATGFSVLIQRVHTRVTDMDKRVDGIELRIAENYLSKAEFSTALERVEQHMIRIENKLDAIVR